jgi:hypothetical protein
MSDNFGLGFAGIVVVVVGMVVTAVVCIVLVVFLVVVVTLIVVVGPTVVVVLVVVDVVGSGMIVFVPEVIGSPDTAIAPPELTPVAEMPVKLNWNVLLIAVKLLIS